MRRNLSNDKTKDSEGNSYEIPGHIDNVGTKQKGFVI
jgi:hypothetical protein